MESESDNKYMKFRLIFNFEKVVINIITILHDHLHQQDNTRTKHDLIIDKNSLTNRNISKNETCRKHKLKTLISKLNDVYI